MLVAPAPRLLARLGIERADRSGDVLAVDGDARAPIRNALLELAAAPGGGRSDVLNRTVEESRVRAVGSVRPLLGARRPRPEVDGVSLLVGVHIRRDLAIGVDLAPGDAVDERHHPLQ